MSSPKKEGEEEEEEVPDAATTEETSANDDDRNLETQESSAASSLAEVKNMVHNTKVENGKSVWAMTLETFHMADVGKSKKTDVIVNTNPEALATLQEMIQEAKEAEKDDDKRSKWDMPWTPLKEFEASPDDVLLAFCLWTRKESNGNDMNITKAFHRFQAYVNWMYDHRETISEPTLITTESVAPALRAFGFQVTHDASDRLVAWVDFQQFDGKAIKTGAVSVQDSIRATVWFTHLLMLDKKAQDNGMIFVEDLAHKGVFQLMTLFPMEVGTQMDRLTIGILPIKTKCIYILGAATSMKLLLGMMKPFLSKKMRQRIVTVAPKDAEEKVKELVGGNDHIPSGIIEGVSGTLEKDIIFGKYIPS